MTRSFKILTEAALDIKEITRWYKSISQLLAIRFVSQLYDGFARITTTPDIWFNLTKKVRRYKLADFPFMILFFKESDTIVVFAVVHERRKPRVWMQRLKPK